MAGVKYSYMSHHPLYCKAVAMPADPRCVIVNACERRNTSISLMCKRFLPLKEGLRCPLLVQARIFSAIVSTSCERKSLLRGALSLALTPLLSHTVMQIRLRKDEQSSLGKKINTKKRKWNSAKQVPAHCHANCRKWILIPSQCRLQGSTGDIDNPLPCSGESESISSLIPLFLSPIAC